MKPRLSNRANNQLSVNAALEWWDANPTAIRRAEGSSLHKLIEAWNAGIAILPYSAIHLKNLATQLINGPNQVFLVQHNWAAALGDAIDLRDSEYRLPYHDCVFEFDIGGHRVIHIEQEETASVLAVHSLDRWCVFPIVGVEPPPVQRMTGLEGIFQTVAENVRAMTVAVDAQVAGLQRVAAPVALNKARIRARRPSLADYHVVDLSRQSSKVASDSDFTGGTSKRLHFRRGHWRHIKGERTWIRWTLAGNADLGFIDKRYKL